MTIEELVAKMQKINEDYSDDPERAHVYIDGVFLEYIDDDRVDLEYAAVVKWFA